MVACCVRRLGGVRAPSLARPMLESANRSFLSGHPITAAVLLREALRRHLAAECAIRALDTGGDAQTLLDRVNASGESLSSLYGDVLIEVDDVLALRAPGKSIRLSLELCFELIDSDISRNGGAL